MLPSTQTRRFIHHSVQCAEFYLSTRLLLSSSRRIGCNLRRLASSSSTTEHDDDSDKILMDFLRRDADPPNIDATRRSHLSPLVNLDTLRSDLFDDDNHNEDDEPNYDAQRDQPKADTKDRKDEKITLHGDEGFIILQANKFQRRSRRRTPTTDIEPSADLDRDSLDSHFSLLMSKDSENSGFEDMSEGLEAMRPHANLVSHARYAQIEKSIDKAFKRKQLLEYLNQLESSQSSTQRKRKTSLKSDMVRHIIHSIWGIKISADITKDLLTQREFVTRDRRDMILLLSKDALLLRKTTELGLTVQVGRKSNAIELIGPESAVERAMKRLDHIIQNVVEQEVDLEFLLHTHNISIDDIPFSVISHLSETFVEPIDRRTIRISAFVEHRIALARRLIVLSLKLYRRESSKIYFVAGSLTESDTAFYNVYDTSCLPWYARNSRWQRWRSVRSRYNSSESVPSDPDDFIAQYPMLILRELNQLNGNSYSLIDPTEVEDYALQLVGFDPKKGNDQVIDSTVGELMRRMVDQNSGDRYLDVRNILKADLNEENTGDIANSDGEADTAAAKPEQDFANVFTILEENASLDAKNRETFIAAGYSATYVTNFSLNIQSVSLTLICQIWIGSA